MKYALVLAIALAAASAHANDLTIEVAGTTGKGQVMVAVYNSEATWMQKPLMGTKVASSVQSTRISLHDLPAGEYALVAYEDQNDNGKLDKNQFGMPTEPFGFSNDATGHFGPAKWEAAHFRLDAQQQTVRFSLH